MSCDTTLLPPPALTAGISRVKRNRVIPWFMSALVCGAMIGCGAPASVKIRPELRVSQPDLGFGPAALEQAGRDFLGPAQGSGGSQPGLSTAAGGGLRSDLDLSGLRGHERALAVQVDQTLSETWSLQARFRAGQSDIRQALPAGSLRLGRVLVLADGVITARTRFIEAEALALRQVPTALPGRLDLGAGLGARMTQSDLRVRVDALFAIDAHSTYRQTRTFGLIQARYQWDRLPAHLFVEGRVYRSRQAGLRAGLDIALP